MQLYILLELFAAEVGINPRLVLTREAKLAQRMQAVKLQLFKVSFAPYGSDPLYRLMEFIGDHAEKGVRRPA